MSNCSFRNRLTLIEEIEGKEGGKARRKDAIASQLIRDKAGAVSLSYVTRQ